MTTDRGYPWLKIYTNLVDDPLFMRLPTGEKAVYFLLYLLAGRADSGGFILVGDGMSSTDDLAYFLRMDTDVLNGQIDNLAKSGLLTCDGKAFSIARFQDEQGPAQSEKREVWKKRQDKKRGKLNTSGETMLKKPDQKEYKDKDKEEDEEVTRDSYIVTRDKQKSLHTSSKCPKCGKPLELNNNGAFELILDAIIEKFPDADDELLGVVATDMTGNCESWCSDCDIPLWVNKALRSYAAWFEGLRQGDHPMGAFVDEFERVTAYVG
jgi:hypothetical protein